jgi:hypothetical protein
VFALHTAGASLRRLLPKAVPCVSAAALWECRSVQCRRDALRTDGHKTACSGRGVCGHRVCQPGVCRPATAREKSRSRSCCPAPAAGIVATGRDSLSQPHIGFAAWPCGAACRPLTSAQLATSTWQSQLNISVTTRPTCPSSRLCLRALRSKVSNSGSRPKRCSSVV